MRVMAHRPLIVAAALARGAGPRHARLGEDRRGRAHGRRAGVPGEPCLAVSRTTGYQIKVADERNVVRRARGRQDRRLVDRARQAHDRADRVLRQGPRRPGLGADHRPAPRQDALFAHRHAEPDRSSSQPYFGQTVQFPLGRALNVKKGYVIALTVPTWAPALTPLLTDHSSWRASRPKGKCNDTEHADRADVAQPGRAVPLPLQGAADLLGDAGHPPGTQPGRDRRPTGFARRRRGELDARGAVGHLPACRGRAGRAARR